MKDYITNVNSVLKNLLTENFLKWQLSKGEQKMQREFAEEVLGIHKVTFSRIYNGKQEVTSKMLIRFAEKTGDPRFYDLAGAPRPDMDFQYIRKVWDKLSPESRAAIREKAEEYVTIENENEKRG